jgi:hypothetical protein
MSCASPFIHLRLSYRLAEHALSFYRPRKIWNSLMICHIANEGHEIYG